jgi:hypothetical protein
MEVVTAPEVGAAGAGGAERPKNRRSKAVMVTQELTRQTPINIRDHAFSENSAV